MQEFDLFEKNIQLYGEVISLVEWAEKYFSIQMTYKTYETIQQTIKPSIEMIEDYMYKYKEFFVKDSETNMVELIVKADSALYKYLLEEKQKS